MKRTYSVFRMLFSEGKKDAFPRTNPTCFPNVILKKIQRNILGTHFICTQNGRILNNKKGMHF